MLQQLPCFCSTASAARLPTVCVRLSACSPRSVADRALSPRRGSGAGGLPLPRPPAAPVLLDAANRARLPRVPPLPPLQDAQPAHARLLPVYRARVKLPPRPRSGRLHLRSHGR